MKREDTGVGKVIARLSPMLLIVAAALLYLSGCATTMSRAQIEQYKGGGKVAVMMVPPMYTLHDLTGIGGGEDAFAAAYGNRPPWRGERLTMVMYRGLKPYYYPFGIDLRSIALGKLVSAAENKLGLKVAIDPPSEAFRRLSGETYWSMNSFGYLNFTTGEKRKKEEWQALARDGISAVMIVELHQVVVVSDGMAGYTRINEGSVGVVMALSVIDTATGGVVHSGTGRAYKEMSMEPLRPFFPAINQPATIFGTGDGVKAYGGVVTKDPKQIEWLAGAIGERLETVLNAELEKIAKK